MISISLFFLVLVRPAYVLINPNSDKDCKNVQSLNDLPRFFSYILLPRYKITSKFRNVLRCENDEEITHFKVDSHLIMVETKDKTIDKIPTKLQNHHYLVITLTHNKITNIPENAFAGDNLSGLDLSHNQIEFVSKNAFSNLKAIVHINLSFNKIKSFDAFIYVKVINPMMLDLSKFFHIFLDNNLELEHFFFNSSFEMNKYKYRISLNDTKVRSFNYIYYIHVYSRKSYEGLKYLDDPYTTIYLGDKNIGYYQIESNHPINRNIYSQCETPILDLFLREKDSLLETNYTSANRMLNRHPKLKIIQNLSNFDFSFNKLTKLDQDDYYPSSVQIINLSHNLIEFISPKTFLGLVNLKKLLLNNNMLKNVDSIQIESSKLFYLDLSKNLIVKINEILLISNVDLNISIYLDNNKISKLPNIIGNIKRLSILSVTNQSKQLNFLRLNFPFILSSDLSPIISLLDLSSNNLRKFSNDLFCYLGQENNLTIDKIDLRSNPIDLESLECLKEFQFPEYNIQILHENSKNKKNYSNCFISDEMDCEFRFEEVIYHRIGAMFLDIFLTLLIALHLIITCFIIKIKFLS
ncbi:unnamed protein product [Brachionus calyciflorus]|uniref:Uncharacterized protein n=1 Tax=Brachionus calyciflorus TaxID=104777 RepID=A0A813LYG0_9BILA|nr:unnamed protein product [Brachionus calyciflorus]